MGALESAYIESLEILSKWSKEWEEKYGDPPFDWSKLLNSQIHLQTHSLPSPVPNGYLENRSSISEISLLRDQLSEMQKELEEAKSYIQRAESQKRKEEEMREYERQREIEIREAEQRRELEEASRRAEDEQMQLRVEAALRNEKEKMTQKIVERVMYGEEINILEYRLLDGTWQSIYDEKQRERSFRDARASREEEKERQEEARRESREAYEKAWEEANVGNYH